MQFSPAISYCLIQKELKSSAALVLLFVVLEFLLLGKFFPCHDRAAYPLSPERLSKILLHQWPYKRCQATCNHFVNHLTRKIRNSSKDMRL